MMPGKSKQRPPSAYPAMPEPFAEASSLQPTASSKAFSLVEVTLALMVVSVGMLAVFSLFPTGLDQGARAMNDTHAALFADEVFSGLRAYAEINWDGIGTVALYTASESAWTNSADGALDPSLNNEIRTNIYYVSNSIVDHVFRYCISLATNGNIKSATLRVWAGKYGGTSAPPSVFYAEFFKNRP